jgi:hypothetical protein
MLLQAFLALALFTSDEGVLAQALPAVAPVATTTPASKADIMYVYQPRGLQLALQLRVKHIVVRQHLVLAGLPYENITQEAVHFSTGVVPVSTTTSITVRAALQFWNCSVIGDQHCLLGTRLSS